MRSCSPSRQRTVSRLSPTLRLSRRAISSLLLRTSRPLTFRRMSSGRTPFDCLYKEHPVRATADGAVTLRLEADAGDVGDTVLLAVYDRDGRLLRLTQETIAAAGPVELSAPAQGGYKASAYQLDTLLRPKEEKETSFLEAATAEE